VLSAHKLPQIPMFRATGLVLVILLCQLYGYGQGANEYQVKAAYLYNFAKFVEWPAGTFPSVNAPIQLCIFADDPIGTDLKQIASDKVIGGHPVKVVFVQGGEQSRACHILFVGASQNKQSRRILEQLRGVSVLTVGESEGFAGRGGIINFVLYQDRVGFEVNHRAAQEARLNLSARLLSVARVVIE
jgi:hypothetical protein